MKVLSTDEIGERLKATRWKAHGTRLTVFLEQHFDQLLPHLAAGKPGWKVIAETLHDLGVRDATGKPPTPEALRQAWTRLRRQKAVAASMSSATVHLLPRPPVGVSVLGNRANRPAAPETSTRASSMPLPLTRPSSGKTGIGKLAAATRGLRAAEPAMPKPVSAADQGKTTS